jgi:hypothetical protein
MNDILYTIVLSFGSHNYNQVPGLGLMSSTLTMNAAFKFNCDFLEDFFVDASMLLYSIELQLHVWSSFVIPCHKHAYYHIITTLHEEPIFSYIFLIIVFAQGH